MNHEIDRITPKTWVGWLLTMIISIAGSWLSMNARVYGNENDISVLKTRVEVVEKSYDRQIQISERQNELNNEIKQSLVRIEGVLNTKADKQWK